MKFNYKFDHILNLLDTNVSEFAAYSNIETSIVSNWYKDKTTLNITNPNFNKVINAMLQLDKTANILSSFLTKVFQISVIDNQKLLNELLIQWLTYNDEKKLYSTSIDIYNSYEGKKNAIHTILDYSLTLPPGQEIYLSEFHDFSSTTNLKLYISELSNKFTKVLEYGHNLTVIFNYYNANVEMNDQLINWIPLYFTGNLTTYYINKNTDNNFDPNVFIIHKKIALFSYITGSNNDDIYTCIHYDPFSIKQMYNIFLSRLRESKPLISSYHMSNIAAKGFIETFFRYNDSSNNSYYISPSLMISALSRDIIIKIMEENKLTSEEQDIIFNNHIIFNSFFYEEVKSYKIKQYIYINKLVDALNQSETISYELSAFINKKVTISKELLIKHLLITIENLEKYDNYEVKLITDVNNPKLDIITAWIKNNTFLYAFPNDGQKSIILTDSDIAIESFYNKLDFEWSKKPTEKELVIRQLKKLL